MRKRNLIFSCGLLVLLGMAALAAEPPGKPNILLIYADASGVDWNKEIKPGPREIGFDYSFIMAATGDRVPCVYVEDGRVVGLDPADPIKVSYKQPFPSEPTGVPHRDQLKLDWSHGRNLAVVNGAGGLGQPNGFPV